MADSRIIRRSARLFLSGFFHAKDVVEKLPIQNSAIDLTNRLKQFISTFNKEFKKSLSDKK